MSIMLSLKNSWTWNPALELRSKLKPVLSPFTEAHHHHWKQSSSAIRFSGPLKHWMLSHSLFTQPTPFSSLSSSPSLTTSSTAGVTMSKTPPSSKPPLFPSSPTSFTYLAFSALISSNPSLHAPPTTLGPRRCLPQLPPQRQWPYHPCP